MDSIFVLNEATDMATGRPVAGKACSCRKHQRPQHAPFVDPRQVVNATPAPLGLPEWDFAPVPSEGEAESESELVFNAPAIGLPQANWDFPNPLDKPKPQASAPTRNRANGEPEPMPAYEWNW